jgi:hypothetical protein
MATNPYGSFSTGVESPALQVLTITPSDGADQTYILRMIYVGTGGDVALIDISGNSTIHKNVATGQYIGPFRMARVLVTGTTATNMLGYV